MDIPNKYITDMQRQIDACSSYIDALAQGRRSPEKVNTLLGRRHAETGNELYFHASVM